MGRLIDADALMAEMHNIILEDGEDRRTFYEVIERQPTIEPELITEQEAYYQGKIDGIKECTARLKRLTAEFKEMNGGDLNV